MLSLARYKRNNIPLIAITGSVGKTMTKELINNILETKYKVIKSKGNENNHIGLPMTLLKITDKTDIIVTEMGMNHLGEISFLSKLAKPDTSVITNIGTSHIGYLKSKKNIFKAKMEIIDGMNGGNLILNGEDKYLKKVKLKNTKVYFSNENLSIHNIIEEENKTIFDILYQDIYYKFILNAPSYLISNVLLAIQTCLLYDIKISDMIKVVADYKQLHNRMNIRKYKNNTILDDCYNASYESMIKALEQLNKYKQKKIIIIGEILELGSYTKKIHKKINKIIKKIDNKEVYLIGEGTKYIKGMHFSNIDEMVTFFNSKNIDDSVILIKGSRKNKLEKISSLW